MPIEVGDRCKFCSLLGITGTHKRTAISGVSEAKGTGMDKCLLDTDQAIIVTWARPETPQDPSYYHP